MLAIVLLAAQQPPTPVKDARVTVHFTAALLDGTVLADTESRGMAFTFLMDQDTVEPFWHQAVRGLRVGESRTVRVKASEAGVALPGDPAVTVAVRLVKVAPL
jgi:FKBP-type peptidyl-prolyl cis-trans isomerase